MTSPVRVAVPVALMVFTMIIVYGALEMSDSEKSALDTLWDMMYGKKGNSQEIELETLVQEENEKRRLEMPDESLEAVNCVGDWSGTWSGCSEDCGPGSQTMDWVVSTDEINSGTCANRGTTKSQDCKIKECTANEAVNCVGDWSNPWSGCSEDCGPGTQTKTWKVTTAAQHSGTCANEGTTKRQDCKIKECPVPAVCGWTNTGGCNTSDGKQTQTRYTITAAQHGGTACGSETQDIDCDVDCVQGAWTNNPDGCNSSTGKQSQTRTTTTAAQNSGTACGRETKDIFCAVNCVQSDWTNSGVCSKTCGTGKQSQTRTTTIAALNSGTACGGETQEIDCDMNECPVPCEGNWSNPWSACSKDCGPGTQTKTWKVTTTAQHGGTCVNEGTTKSQDCKIKECPLVLDSFDNDKLYLKTKDGIYLGTGSDYYNARLGFVTGVKNTQFPHRKYPNGYLIVKKYFTLDGPLDSVVIQGDTPNQPNWAPAVVKAVCTGQFACWDTLKDLNHQRLGSYALWNFEKQSDGGYKIMYGNKRIQQNGNNIMLGDNGDVFYLERAT